MKPFDAVEGWLFVDPGRSTGLCWVDSSTPILAGVAISRKTWPVALDDYRCAMADRIGLMASVVVCVEGYSQASRGTQAQTMVEIGAAVRMAAAEVGSPVIEMAPALWKSITFRGKKGSSGYNKEYILRTEQLTGIRTDNVDKADALLMAWAAGTILSDRTRSTKGMINFRMAVKEAME